MRSDARVQTFPPGRLRALLGPAEAQYQILTLGLEGQTSALACGTTVVDQSAEDTDPALGAVRVTFVWNDLVGETGYRAQFDTNSATFVTEDLSGERPADATFSNLGASFGGGPGSTTSTGRVFGHIGHGPNHGANPGGGDVVSNECTVTFVVPNPP